MITLEIGENELDIALAATGWPPPLPDPDKATVYGEVFNDSYELKPNITVEIHAYGVSGTYSAITDQNGRYVIENIPPGSYHFQLYTAGGSPCGWRSCDLPVGNATRCNCISTT